MGYEIYTTPKNNFILVQLDNNIKAEMLEILDKITKKYKCELIGTLCIGYEVTFIFKKL